MRFEEDPQIFFSLHPCRPWVLVLSWNILQTANMVASANFHPPTHSTFTLSC